MVDHIAGGNTGLSRRFCAKGIIKLIASFFLNNRRFKVQYFAICALYTECKYRSTEW